jgi:hypothetical protein
MKVISFEHRHTGTLPNIMGRTEKCDLIETSKIRTERWGMVIFGRL